MNNISNSNLTLSELAGAPVRATALVFCLVCVAFLLFYLRTLYYMVKAKLWKLPFYQQLIALGLNECVVLLIYSYYFLVTGTQAFALFPRLLSFALATVHEFMIRAGKEPLSRKNELMVHTYHKSSNKRALIVSKRVRGGRLLEHGRLLFTKVCRIY